MPQAISFLRGERFASLLSGSIPFPRAREKKEVRIPRTPTHRLNVSLSTSSFTSMPLLQSVVVYGWRWWWHTSLVSTCSGSNKRIFSSLSAVAKKITRKFLFKSQKRNCEQFVLSPISFEDYAERDEFISEDMRNHFRFSPDFFIIIYTSSHLEKMLDFPNFFTLNLQF